MEFSSSLQYSGDILTSPLKLNCAAGDNASTELKSGSLPVTVSDPPDSALKVEIQF